MNKEELKDFIKKCNDSGLHKSLVPVLIGMMGKLHHKDFFVGNIVEDKTIDNEQIFSVRWVLQAIEDAKEQHGIDIESEIMTFVVQELLTETFVRITHELQTGVHKIRDNIDIINDPLDGTTIHPYVKKYIQINKNNPNSILISANLVPILGLKIPETQVLKPYLKQPIGKFVYKIDSNDIEMDVFINPYTNDEIIIYNRGESYIKYKELIRGELKEKTEDEETHLKLFTNFEFSHTDDPVYRQN